MQFILTLEQVNSLMAKLGNIPYMYSAAVIDEAKSYFDPQYVAQAPVADAPVADAPVEQPSA
jgi:hypothetical protein